MVVRGLASLHCGPGSIPRPGVTCGLSFYCFFLSLLQGFFSSSSSFLPSTKTRILGSDSAWKQWKRRATLENVYCKIPIIYLFYLRVVIKKVNKCSSDFSYYMILHFKWGISCSLQSGIGGFYTMLPLKFQICPQCSRHALPNPFIFRQIRNNKQLL